MKKLSVYVLSAALTLSCGNLNGVAGRALTHPTHGVLDTTFGSNGDGKVTAGFGTIYETAESVALQADGKIIVAGDAGLYLTAARFNADGTTDTSFGTSGVVKVNFNSWIYSKAVAIQSDGKIILGGEYFNLGQGYQALARLNSDGSLDTTFDTDGMVSNPVNTSYSMLTAIAIQPDGKILTGGAYSTGGSYDLAVARFNADGSLDTTFATNGSGSYSGTGTAEFVRSILLQSDGKILIAGGLWSNSAEVLRLNANGTVDASFGTAGFATVTFSAYTNAFADLKSAALQSDGNVVLLANAANAQNTNEDQYIVRLTSSGALDSSFGNGGKVIYSFGTSNDLAGALAVQTDGKIVVAGTTDSGSDYDFAVLRLNADGTPDTDFGVDQNGKVVVSIGSSNDYAKALVIDSNGNLVVAGGSNHNATESPSDYDFSLIRLTP